MGLFSVVTHFCLFVAFLLLLLVSLSTPIIKPIYLMKIDVNLGSDLLGLNETMRFGVWGLCIGGSESSFLGIKHVNAGDCTKTKLGYSPDFVGNNQKVNLIVHGLTYVLVLHPIAAGFAFLAFVFSLAISFRHPSLSSRFASLLTLFTTILTSVIATVVFIIDIVFVADARHNAKEQVGSALGVKYGDGTWMTLVAVILLWVSTVGALAGIFACGRRGRTDKY